MPPPDQLIARVAERQHGVFTFGQAVSCGFTPEAIRYRLATRRWVRLHKGVYRMSGSVRSYEQRITARVLACGSGAVAFRRTAGALFEIESVERGIVEVAVAKPRRAKLAHQLSGLRARDLTAIGTIAVTTPQRTVVDLASVLPRDPLEDALDDTIRRGLVRPRELEARLEAMQRRGRTGLGVLLTLVRARTTNDVAGSRLENVVRRALLRGGLPEPVRQHVVLDAAGAFIARPDLSYPDRRLYIEYEGAYHASSRQRQADNDRKNRLSAVGWRPLVFTKESLRRPMSELVEIVRRSLNETRG